MEVQGGAGAGEMCLFCRDSEDGEVILVCCGPGWWGGVDLDIGSFYD